MENEEALPDQWIYFSHLSRRLRDGTVSCGLFPRRPGDVCLGNAGGAGVWRRYDTGVVTWVSAAQKEFEIRELITTRERNRSLTKPIQDLHGCRTCIARDI